MWWRDAVTYQVYLRSFADGNGDGIGDLAGLRSRLPYLHDLGIDALWVTTPFVSPMVDAGYDVLDHRDIDPLFGSLADADTLLTEAHHLGLKVIFDIVPNGCSDQHPWFQAALKAGPGSPERERFFFCPGKGPNGDEPPNDWPSFFGGPTWTRTVNADGSPGEWYLHLFSPQQPDFNWSHPDVAAEFESIQRFWFDRGLDGFRVDVAFGLVKEEGLPDTAGRTPPPFEDQPGLHDIYRSWRAIADSYPDRMYVGEVWVDTAHQLARYVRPDELHTAFTFGLLLAAWDATSMRNVIEPTIRELGAVGASPVWVLSNHDVPRHVTRYGRKVTSLDLLDRKHGAECDLALGARRARAALLLMLALPGGAYLYQGEELGLYEVDGIPHDLLQDPTLTSSSGTNPGREGCRVPLPWSGHTPPFGFSNSHAWLPQPEQWHEWTVQAQTGKPGSMLEYYRRALWLRRELPALGDGTMTWLDAQAGVLAFSREPEFCCIVNLSGCSVDLPPYREVLMSSVDMTDGVLPADGAAWLRLSP
jgi:alpha-glucosidase